MHTILCYIHVGNVIASPFTRIIQPAVRDCIALIDILRGSPVVHHNNIVIIF